MGMQIIDVGSIEAIRARVKLINEINELIIDSGIEHEASTDEIQMALGVFFLEVNDMTNEELEVLKAAVAENGPWE